MVLGVIVVHMCLGKDGQHEQGESIIVVLATVRECLRSDVSCDKVNLSVGVR